MHFVVKNRFDPTFWFYLFLLPIPSQIKESPAVGNDHNLMVEISSVSLELKLAIEKIFYKIYFNT